MRLRGQDRRAWVFVARCRYAHTRIVFDQSVETWTRLHVSAFESFGGVPRRVVLDNLKAGIVHACLHDPEARAATATSRCYDF
jgi:transposase